MWVSHCCWSVHLQINYKRCLLSISTFFDEFFCLKTSWKFQSKKKSTWGHLSVAQSVETKESHSPEVAMVRSFQDVLIFKHIKLCEQNQYGVTFQSQLQTPVRRTELRLWLLPTAGLLTIWSWRWTSPQLRSAPLLAAYFPAALLSSSIASLLNSCFVGGRTTESLHKQKRQAHHTNELFGHALFACGIHMVHEKASGHSV